MTLDKTLLFSFPLLQTWYFSQKIYLTDLLSRSAETPYYTDAAALHYLFQEDEAKKKKQTPETEISHEEQKLATKFTGPTWYRKNFKRPITAEIEEPFDTKKRQKRAWDLD